MTIEPAIIKLRAKLAVISAGSKSDFLAAFAVIHTKWHTSEMMSGQGKWNGSAYGFLSFHHEVLAVYQARFAPSLAPGTMAHTSPPFRPAIDNAPDAATFSNMLEDWHNSVHRNTTKYGANFADPAKNIYMPRFWQFHKFINIQFDQWLTAHGQVYDAIDHAVV